MNRIVWLVGTLAAVCVFLGVVVWLSTADAQDEPEVARVVSPTGKVDAVLLETNEGSSTSFGYEIYAVEHGARPSGPPHIRLYGAVRNDSAYGVNLKWTSPTSVAVEYLSAKSSIIDRLAVSVHGQMVEFVIHEGIKDAEAPSGGMLYNLRSRR